MVHQAVDRRGRGHLVAEDPVPLAEDQIAGHHHRATLIALGEQREQHLGFVGALLHVAQIVEQDHLEEVELAEGPRQVEVTFGAEQFLHQGVGRDAQHAAAGLDQRVPDGA